MINCTSQEVEEWDEVSQAFMTTADSRGWKIVIKK